MSEPSAFLAALGRTSGAMLSQFPSIACLIFVTSVSMPLAFGWVLGDCAAAPPNAVITRRNNSDALMPVRMRTLFILLWIGDTPCLPGRPPRTVPSCYRSRWPA